MIGWGRGRVIAILAIVPIVAVGCIAGPGRSPSGAPATESLPPLAASSSGPSPSAGSPRPVLTPSPAGGHPMPSPSLPHADPALEGYVPAQIGSVGLFRWSLAGPDVPPPGGDMCLVLCGNEPREFADALGIPLDRVSVALAMGEQGGIGGVAFRARGVATDRLAAAGVAISGGVVGGGGPSFPMTVAGRDVVYLDRLGRGQYLVPIGDVLVFLYGEPPTTGPGQISPDGTVPPGIVAWSRPFRGRPEPGPPYNRPHGP